MVRIACVGIAVQDRIYTLEALPHEGGKYVAQQYREVGGGPAATAAVAAARLGAQVDFIGRVGDDATGTQLFAELESLGVNTSQARQITGARSSQSAILVDAAGERVIVNYPSPDLPDDADWLDGIDFGRYDAVLADVRWHEGATRALTLARRAPGLSPQDALKTTKSLTNGHVYVTLGKEGCLWLENDDTLHRQAGFTVEAVDTTGAGDVFHGALAVMLARGESPQEAVRFASAVAALKCTRPGGRAGIPDCDQTRSFLSLFV
ncbi:PfkB family carbohydrate kinase [Cronobacter sakazakii]